MALPDPGGLKAGETDAAARCTAANKILEIATSTLTPQETLEGRGGNSTLNWKISANQGTSTGTPAVLECNEATHKMSSNKMRVPYLNHPWYRPYRLQKRLEIGTVL